MKQIHWRSTTGNHVSNYTVDHELSAHIVNAAVRPKNVCIFRCFLYERRKGEDTKKAVHINQVCFVKAFRTHSISD